MPKILRVYSMLFLSSIIITVSGAPMQAFIKETHQQPTEINNGYLALSWGDIWDILRRKKVAGGRRGDICAIAPQKLVNPNLSNSETQEVWSEYPLFLWYSRVSTEQKIELFQKGSKQVFWSRKIAPGETKVIYDGKPLQLGQSYEWKVLANIPFPVTSGATFQIMGPKKRDRITNDLKQREQQLKKQGANPEKIALEKANYFAQQELWSDALREIYSVPNPSPELTKIIQQIPSSNYCNPAANTALML